MKCVTLNDWKANEDIKKELSNIQDGEQLKDKSWPVLDKGFVRLIDFMGNDDRIVQAARVSYGKGTKTKREDAGLIDYLMRNKHTSPFEQVEFTFHIKMPIFVARQWIRHRTASLNEYSGRYSIMTEDRFLPDTWRTQSAVNKQGSENFSRDDVFTDAMDSLTMDVYDVSHQSYESLLENGVAKELARIVLPLSTYTEMYWKMDLHNLLHFLALRLDWHAQEEIQQYGIVLGEIVKKICPMTWNSFEEHVLYGGHFSRTEISIVKTMMEKLNLSTKQDLEILLEREMKDTHWAEFSKKIGL